MTEQQEKQLMQVLSEDKIAQINRITDLEAALKRILDTAPRINTPNPDFHMALWDAENLLAPE